MAGSVSSSSSRNLGVDRFYSPPHLRRQLELSQQQEKLQKAAKARQKAAPPPELEAREVESRIDSDDSSSKPSMSASPSPPPSVSPSPAGNLDSFLQSTTPAVNALYPPKMNVRGRRNGETNDLSQPYFFLGDLWESFREWSAYGAGVPVTLEGTESVTQYYVPYLSGIQLYAESQRNRSRSRHPSEETEVSGIDSYRETSTMVGSSSDGGDTSSMPGHLVFEYLERDPPYGREPLADKIAVLANKFPELKTYKSSELLPSSWVSVAWYPIYRIPTGPTLRDLDACFLTFHYLSTSSKEAGMHAAETSHGRPGKTISLPSFGLASYKLKGPVWTPNCPQATSLLQAAESWLRRLRVDHPDFSFFLSHNGPGPASRR